MDWGKLYTMVKPTTTRRNHRILLGISGGVAAYKSPDLVRRLMERGADVRVVMTAAATEFITPLTLQAVSGHPVFQHLLDSDAESGMGHIELARWADSIVIAPATANFIAKITQGLADDLLSTLCLASNAELIVAPAMNQQMWLNAATQANLNTLLSRDIRIIGPGEGDQACGEVGPGRMTEPDQIAQQILGDGIPQLLRDKSIVITAGPTWEAIDPVRGITNHSSGKMGYAMAQAALDFGAKVTLISGPVSLETPSGARRIDVLSADQMRSAALENARQSDLFIGVAAVADYRPESVADQKLKKSSDEMTIRLVKNPDILADISALKNRPVCIGFAAETQSLEANAQKKLQSKNLDMIVANNVAGSNSAFGSDRNQVTLFYGKEKMPLPEQDKYGLSVSILEIISKEIVC